MVAKHGRACGHIRDAFCGGRTILGSAPVRYCDALDDDLLARIVTVDRGEDGLTDEIVSATLGHLFVHQIHRRGQAHAMLSGTPVAPRQLDEFFLEYDAPRRREEPKTLG